MTRRYLLIFVLLLNQALINSVLADSHISATESGLFDAPHIHLDLAGEHDVDETESGLDGHQHDKAGHVHIPCDLCSVHELAATNDSIPVIKNADYHPAYLSLSYRPAVPPPNA